MILLIDNYDSFSYNLYQYLGSLDDAIRVARNDELTVDEVAALACDRIVLSPGPGYPRDAGICEDVVRRLSGTVPILGVCLGHQAICEAFGATIVHAPKLMHGKQSDVELDGACPLFCGLPSHTKAARYHSLVADPATVPSCLKVVATAPSGEVMAVEHKTHPTFGVQFHPESIMTPDGMQILENFLALPKAGRGGRASTEPVPATTDPQNEHNHQRKPRKAEK